MVEYFIWNISTRARQILCINFLALEILFTFHKECCIKHFQGCISYTQEKRSFCCKSLGRTPLCGPVNELVVTSNQPPPGCNQLQCSPLGANDLHTVRVQMKKEIISSFRRNTSIQSSRKLGFSHPKRIWVRMIFVLDALSAQSASLKCCTNESEATHVLCWRREFVFPSGHSVKCISS